jgi:hypothetical protein
MGSVSCVIRFNLVCTCDDDQPATPPTWNVDWGWDMPCMPLVQGWNTYHPAIPSRLTAEPIPTRPTCLPPLAPAPRHSLATDSRSAAQPTEQTQHVGTACSTVPLVHGVIRCHRWGGGDGSRVSNGTRDGFPARRHLPRDGPRWTLRYHNIHGPHHETNLVLTKAGKTCLWTV